MRTLLVGLTAGALLLTAAPAFAADTPPRQPYAVGTALPPGENGRVTVADQARGMLTGDYGPHTEDQRELYWDGRYKDGRFQAQGPAEAVGKARVRRDGYGVPAVYADTSYDTWYAAGYTAGQDRLFLADGVRHVAEGTYAELVGPSGVPADIQTRTLTYSDADYDAMFKALPAESQNVLKAYVAGLNAYIQHVRVTPAELPAEYALLTTVPQDWTLKDTLASGVLLTRFVAASGGEEFREISVLRELQKSLGTEGGLKAFTDLRWQQDDKASVTVPDASGTFHNNDPVPAAKKDAVLRKSAAYALALPPELATGPGTGAAPVPAVPTGIAPPPLLAKSLSGVIDSLLAFRANLHGGSYMFTISGKRTSTGAPMLVNGPQLGYTFPTELYEQEVHGGGYDARGVTVPGVPTVAIGYGSQIAWGMTTGYSKTIDSFIETTRRTGGKLQYLHQGTWKDADCRTEVFRYRAAAQGVPIGPAVFTQKAEICRTLHGPIVASSKDGTLARSVDYAMYHRELENINGILQWDRAKNLQEFEAGVRQVTWNENVMYAGADGHIAYWHPGLYPRRSPDWDTRFPAPGTGEYDNRGALPFEQMPHAVDPAVGYLANWNNKPARAWVDDYLDPASSRSAGKAVRVQTIQLALAAQPKITPEALRATEFRIGTTDHRYPDFQPLLVAAGGSTEAQRKAIALVKAWNGRSYGPGAGTSAGSYKDLVTDGPGPTIFRHFLDDLRDEVLADLPADIVVAADNRGSHVFDGTPADQLVLRNLVPPKSSLRPSRDYLHGRSTNAVVLAALDRSIAALTKQYGTDMSTWRDQHPRSTIKSLTGVIGPSRTMPYEDRGSWVQVIAFDRVARAVAAPPVVRPRQQLPATGLGLLPAALGLLVLTAGLVLRRRRTA
ncbi:MAG: penicillin acylase family protein [Actinobacteria bacterium]|nr:penicillin acylase family protein [Actinomycetota bacterium]